MSFSQPDPGKPPPLPRAELPWCIERARDGEPVLKIAGRATDSLYRPGTSATKAARQWFEAGAQKGCDLFVLIGSGLGRWLDAFADEGTGELLVWDPFPVMSTQVANAGHALPDEVVGKRRRARITVVNNADAFDTALARLAARTRNPQLATHPGYEAFCRFEARYATRSLRARFLRRKMLAIEDSIASLRGLRVLESLPFVRPLAELGENLAGQTVIIASAGPSLDAALGPLAEHPGGVRFVCVQRLERFERVGARIDYAVCADPQDLYTRFEVPDAADYAPLLTDTGCAPAMIEARRERTFFFQLRSPQIQQAVWDQLELPTIDDPCLTVSEVGVLLAHQMGARRIVLAGVDYTGDDPRYQDRFEVPITGGDLVPTNAHYFQGARMLSTLCPRLAREGTEVLRLGNSGIPIEGTRTIDLETLSRLLTEALPCTPPETGPSVSLERLEAIESAFASLRAHAASGKRPEVDLRDPTGFGQGFAPIDTDQLLRKAELGLDYVSKVRGFLAATDDPNEARHTTRHGFGSRQTPPSHASTT